MVPSMLIMHLTFGSHARLFCMMGLVIMMMLTARLWSWMALMMCMTVVLVTVVLMFHTKAF
jgi:hypothetical protein